MPIRQFYLEFVCQHLNDELGEERGGRAGIGDKEKIRTSAFR